jgi:hypothetical protein
MRLYKTPGASAYLRDRHGINRASSYLQKLRVVGGGPDFRRVGSRDVAYEEAALDAWARSLISKPLRSTSEAA